MRFSLLLLFLSVFSSISAQQVLHYSETSGFDHNTRAVSLAMFQTLGTANGFTVVNDEDGSEFNTLANLQQFDVVIFSNTSGNAILDPTQRANFEAYISAGGSYLGIHAASDTYRHSSANGNNTGTWDFYSELMGASVQENPNHVSGTPSYSMDHIGAHASTASLPDPWAKNEEYYYWENGYFGSNNNTVLEVEQTVGPNGMVNSYDAPRPMSWYRALPSGSKIFYTALGHAPNNFTGNSLFIAHISDALSWALDFTTSAPSLSMQTRPTLLLSDGGFNIEFPSDWKYPVEATFISLFGSMIQRELILFPGTLLRSPTSAMQQRYLILTDPFGRSTALPTPPR